MVLKFAIAVYMPVEAKYKRYQVPDPPHTTIEVLEW